MISDYECVDGFLLSEIGGSFNLQGFPVLPKPLKVPAHLVIGVSGLVVVVSVGLLPAL